MVQWWADYLDENRIKLVSPYDFAKYIIIFIFIDQGA
jgi:hypothetical protein